MTRLCIDFRKLNEHVIRERRQIPTLDEITAQMHGAKVFSVLDAESGFHQLELDEDSRNLTTFITHKGLFHFCRLPFGIASTPETFQRVLSDILEDLEGVFVYIDDILIVGKDEEEHDHRLKLVLERLSAVNFTADSALLSAFRSCQEAAATDLTSLTFFDVSTTRRTAVSCDASPVGLGAVL